MSEHLRDPADVVHVRGSGWPRPVFADPPAGVSEHGCQRGWLAVEAEDARPIPCPRCKPHLSRPAPDHQHDDQEDDHAHHQP